jgi:hypothetical protein
MPDSIPKNGSSTRKPHTESENPNPKISPDQHNFHDLENIEQNLDYEAKIPYIVSNKEVNYFK